jgi:hypothetical protein
VSDSFVQATPYRLKIIIAPLFGRSMVYHGIHPVDLNKLDSRAEASFMKGFDKTPRGNARPLSHANKTSSAPFHAPGFPAFSARSTSR